MVVPIRHLSGSFRQCPRSRVFRGRVSQRNSDLLRPLRLAHPLLLSQQPSASLLPQRLGCCVIERRRWPRREVAWGARILLRDGVVIAAKAIDASLHGLRVAVDQVAAAVLRREGKCRVEVCLVSSEATFLREAEVRHVDEHGVGLAITEPLPAAILPSRNDEPISDTTAAPEKSNGRPSPTRTLRSIASTLYRR